MKHVRQYRVVHEGDNLSDHSYVTNAINVPNLTSDYKPLDGIAWNMASLINTCNYKCCLDSR